MKNFELLLRSLSEEEKMDLINNLANIIGKQEKTVEEVKIRPLRSENVEKLFKIKNGLDLLEVFYRNREDFVAKTLLPSIKKIQKDKVCEQVFFHKGTERLFKASLGKTPEGDSWWSLSEVEPKQKKFFLFFERTVFEDVETGYKTGRRRDY